jgi:hypothetical protein
MRVEFVQLKDARECRGIATLPVIWSVDFIKVTLIEIVKMHGALLLDVSVGVFIILSVVALYSVVGIEPSVWLM